MITYQNANTGQRIARDTASPRFDALPQWQRVDEQPGPVPTGDAPAEVPPTNDDQDDEIDQDASPTDNGQDDGDQDDAIVEAPAKPKRKRGKA